MSWYRLMWQQFVSKLKSLIQPKAVYRQGQFLYTRCVEQARQPQFYASHGVEDAIGTRFELLTLHVTMVIHALKSVPKEDARRDHAVDLAQSLFDAFVGALDHTLREQGVGDLTVPKKMKKLGAVIYTRMTRWDSLWKDGDAEAQADYLARTVYAATAYESDETEDGALNPEAMTQARWMAQYVADACKGLDIDTLLKGRIDWPTVTDAETA